MANVSVCPGCGAELDYTAREVRLLTGTCAQCARVTTLLEGEVPVPAGAPTSAAPGVRTEEASGRAGPECAECGAALTVAALPDGGIEVRCPECETVSRFVPEEQATTFGRRDRDERPDRPARRDERGPPGAARSARPCRQCGAPLTFTTDADGVVTGECRSCGNRFTLPPRRDTGPSRGGRGYGPRSSGRGDRGPPRWTPRAGGRFDRRAKPYGRRDRSEGDEDDDDRRTRRRRSS